jgi:hypothetical protein
MPCLSRKTLAALTAGLFLLAGCATQPCCTAPASAGGNAVAVAVAPTPPLPPPPAAVVATPQRFVAVGHGAQGNGNAYSATQHRLMAMRAAQVDAYRNLAEQVYGFRVWGNTTVSAFVTQNDAIRTYVDAFIRGARLVGMSALPDGSYEATVELELSRNFLDCFGPQGYCAAQAPSCATRACNTPVAAMPLANACGAPGCTAPSAVYVSD